MQASLGSGGGGRGGVIRACPSPCFDQDIHLGTNQTWTIRAVMPSISTRYFDSPFTNALILTMDGGGFEGETDGDTNISSFKVWHGVGWSPLFALPLCKPDPNLSAKLAILEDEKRPCVPIGHH